MLQFPENGIKVCSDNILQKKKKREKCTKTSLIFSDFFSLLNVKAVVLSSLSSTDLREGIIAN